MNAYLIAKLLYAAPAAANYVTIVNIRGRRSVREIQGQPLRSFIPGKGLSR